MNRTSTHPTELTRGEVLAALAAALIVASLVLWPVVLTGEVPVPADAVDRVEPWRSESPEPVADGALWNPLITDSLWQVVPEGVASHRLWTRGLPLWDPNPACGVPGLAQGRMYSNPIFNLTARLTGPLSAIGWTALLQLTIALWGAYLLARQLGVVPAAAALAAVVFGLNLYLVVWLPHLSFFGAMVWLPLLFFSFERAFATGRPSWAAVGAVVFALQLLEGHIATPFFGAVTLGVWSVVRGAAAARTSRRLAAAIRPVATAAGMLVLGAVLVAPQLLATAELFFETPRGAALGRGTTIEAEQAMRIVAPWFWGHRFHGGTYAGPVNVAELGLYFGILPLALIILAPLGARRLEGWFFAATSVLCGLVIFDIPPLRVLLGWVFPILYQSFPGRIFAIAALAGAMAAGLGAHWLLVDASQRGLRRWAAAVTAGAAVVWALAGWVAVVHRPAAIVAHKGVSWVPWLERLRVESLLWAGFWAVAGVVAVWLCRRKGTLRPRWLWAPAVVAAVDLLRVGMPTIPFYPPEEILPATPTIMRLSSLVEASDHQARILPLPSQQVIPGQVPTVFDLPSVTTYSSWPLTRYDRYATLTGLRYLNWPFIYFDECCSPTMNALAGRFVVARDGLRIATTGGAVETGLSSDGPVRILDNPDALPRARLVGHARWVDPGDLDEVERELLSPGFDERREVVLEGEAVDPIASGGGDRIGSATIVSDLPTMVEIDTESDRPSILVLADSWYPGWRATVDGEPVEVFPANLALRGVLVPAGGSTVVFRYRPWWLVPGVCLSLLGVAVLVGLFRRR